MSSRNVLLSFSTPVVDVETRKHICGVITAPICYNLNSKILIFDFRFVVLLQQIQRGRQTRKNHALVHIAPLPSSFLHWIQPPSRRAFYTKQAICGLVCGTNKIIGGTFAGQLFLGKINSCKFLIIL